MKWVGVIENWQVITKCLHICAVNESLCLYSVTEPHPVGINITQKHHSLWQSLLSLSLTSPLTHQSVTVLLKTRSEGWFALIKIIQFLTNHLRTHNSNRNNSNTLTEVAEDQQRQRINLCYSRGLKTAQTPAAITTQPIAQVTVIKMTPQDVPEPASPMEVGVLVQVSDTPQVSFDRGWLFPIPIMITGGKYYDLVDSC